MNPLKYIPAKVRPWVVLLLLLLLAVWVWRMWPRWARLFRQDYGRDDEQAPVTDARRAELEALSRRLLANVESWGTANDELWAEAAQLNDGELRYLANFYENTVSGGQPFFEAVDSLSTLDADIQQQLLGRLRALALA